MLKPFSFTKQIKQFDWILFLIIFLLLVLGLVVQYSLTLNIQGQTINNFTKQVIFVGFGLFLFFLVSFFDYRALKTYAYFLYFFILILLTAVLFFGQTFRGTKGWLSLGPLNFQVVELVKIVLIVVLARYWTKCAQRIIQFKDIILSGLLISLPISLIILQPDLGSAVLLVGLWLIMFLMIGRKFSHFFIVLFLIGIIVVASWFFVLEDYQKNRILTFLNPQRDPLGQGYQITQSIVAVGSGEFFGRGLGLGSQSQLRFLPAAETDFVFAVIAEELGILGSFLVLGLFILLFHRLIKIAKLSYDNFSLFLVLGIMSIFFIQIIINIGMNMGLAPIMGIPLPLISYGGSSLIMSLIALGIVESMALHGVKSYKEKLT